MGRNFNNSTSDYINLGDPSTDCRFEKDKLWSFNSFFRVENTAGDSRTIVSKWDDGANDRQFLIRTTDGAAPQALQVYRAANLVITGASSLQLNTWYLVSVQGGTDPSAGALRLYTFGMDGTVIDDGLTGQLNADDTLTTDIWLGLREGGLSDPMDGDLAHTSYIHGVRFSKQECLEYLRNPARTLSRYAVDVQFYLPLGVSSPEVDLSGRGNSGTVVGSPTVGGNPPVAPWYGNDVFAELGAAAAPPGFVPYPRPRGARAGMGELVGGRY